MSTHTRWDSESVLGIYLTPSNLENLQCLSIRFMIPTEDSSLRTAPCLLMSVSPDPGPASSPIMDSQFGF
jgi:hypothetical protein